MGTYIVRPTTVVSRTHTGASTGWSGVSDAATLASIHADTDGDFISMSSNTGTEAGTLRFGFTGASFYLDGSLVPIAFASLPAGFTPTTAFVSASGFDTDQAGSGNYVTNVFLQFAEATESTAFVQASAKPYEFSSPVLPSALDLSLNGCGVRGVVTLTGANVGIGNITIDALSVHGSYAIVSAWYHNPVTDAYQYSASDPGAPWVLGSPTLTLTSVSPTRGTTAGGTAVTLTGTGFGVDATVTFGASAATSVVVVNSTSITCVAPAHAVGAVTVTVTNIDTTTAALAAAFTYYGAYGLDWTSAGVEFADDFVFDGFTDGQEPFTFYLAAATTTPSAYVLAFSFRYRGVYFPIGTRIAYRPVTAPVDTGWWLSVDQDFNGAASALYATRPKDPRSYKEIVAFATGSTAPHGGFPGPSCVSNNALLYAEGGYTVGSSSPVIRIYNGLLDREVARVPKVAGVESKAIITMLAAGGTIYFSTLDSGTSSADWSGRVFSLDLESGTVTQIGATFAAGHVPYALAWHAGRLWCGTHRQSSAAAGKVYFFRPGIDTTWTADYDLATSGVANVTSLLSYKGRLFVGTTAAAATFAKILVRSEVGVYTTSDTGTGGAATANNGFLALAEFGGALYASYWNADTPKISKIRAFDNTTWTTAYTGATTTLVPFVGFPQDTGVLLAIGGSVGYSGTLLSTVNGTAWSDRTAFLTQFSPTSTGLPIFGVIGH